MRAGHASRKAFAMVEYMVLFIVIISTMVLFRGYILRAFNGQSSRAGEGFAFGRQFSPQNSVACVYDDKMNLWYAQACYNHNYAVAGCKSSADPIACSRGVMTACTLGCQIQLYY